LKASTAKTEWGGVKEENKEREREREKKKKEKNTHTHTNRQECREMMNLRMRDAPQNECTIMKADDGCVGCVETAK
jgi:hypothetical protein